MRRFLASPSPLAISLASSISSSGRTIFTRPISRRYKRTESSVKASPGRALSASSSSASSADAGSSSCVKVLISDQSSVTSSVTLEANSPTPACEEMLTILTGIYPVQRNISQSRAVLSFVNVCRQQVRDLLSSDLQNDDCDRAQYYCAAPVEHPESAVKVSTLVNILCRIYRNERAFNTDAAPN